MLNRKPELQDYGIKQQQYDVYYDKSNHYLSERDLLFIAIAVFATVLLVVFIVYSDFGKAVLWAFLGLIPGFGVVSIVGQEFKEKFWVFKRSRLLKSHVASQIKLYEEDCWIYLNAQEEHQKAEEARQEAERAQQRAERARRRKLRDFWMSLSGREFEHELATLYRQQGYQVQSTPTSGDEGVDLIIRKNGEKTVVQCKAHKAPVGPAIVRELYGSMVASGADNAILACTGGFTKGVRDFAKGKPIELISASDLVRMTSDA